MITVNAIGDACPIPVIKTKEALLKITGAEIVEVLVDNETAVRNVSKFGANAGGKATSEKTGEKEFKVMIEFEKAPALSADTEATCTSEAKSDVVVVIASDVMGNGKDDLGKVLLKGFIFALTKTDTLPKAVVFYNGGANITTEGSESLEDLKSLEAQGVEILTCGTCLDFYGIKDKLAVGSVTNMYTIVEMLESAGKIIRP
ncbi:MAG: sulfurtransferase-like selenium metabolism protein YedF [Lachnospiraceae bacterium]|jgi:selenium metabolism protein YedF|nr:sulfurtransferase-like selenium metabolism protein YedF [Lachnospiraceae bacterium]